MLSSHKKKILFVTIWIDFASYNIDVLTTLKHKHFIYLQLRNVKYIYSSLYITVSIDTCHEIHPQGKNYY